jgi:hypothetical protein
MAPAQDALVVIPMAEHGVTSVFLMVSLELTRVSFIGISPQSSWRPL